ncbi:helix-turn-helix transcriptional regulator [Kosakonia sp. SOY2]|uniref:helix-turn-helix domain-containing protein n=1 Tax=Kosakonia sp. SOY2 TaxID=3014557 RepID=UPI0022AC8043|nr:helix-turn-helix transcriptional regulator [Kosakonia sp. SOY2]MCZ3384956.1 helix-turn-helix transcriptional regulator [Kosakonia sp. SOY2]
MPAPGRRASDSYPFATLADNRDLPRSSPALFKKSLCIAAGIDEFVASTRINRYEKGVHEPSTEIVQKLAEALRMPLAYFYAEDDGLAELTLLYASATEEHRYALLEYAKKISR